MGVSNWEFAEISGKQVSDDIYYFKDIIESLLKVIRLGMGIFERSCFTSS